MKSRKKSILFVSFLVLITCSQLLIQCGVSKESVKIDPGKVGEMIRDTTFSFMVDYMNPLRGRQRSVSGSNYKVDFRKDTLDSYLPYFGRGYQAPIPPYGGGIDFTTHKFTYKVAKSGDHKWEITMEPKDISGIQKFYFIIFGNGNTTLNVVSTHRDPISFTGQIRPLK